MVAIYHAKKSQVINDMQDMKTALNLNNKITVLNISQLLSNIFLTLGIF